MGPQVWKRLGTKPSDSGSITLGLSEHGRPSKWPSGRDGITTIIIILTIINHQFWKVKGKKLSLTIDLIIKAILVFV